MTTQSSGLFRFPPISLTLKEFFSQYEDALPQLIIVRGGLLGEDDLHSFANDEIFRIDSIDIQPRLIFSDGRGRKISIPQSCPLKFKEVDHKGKGRGKGKRLMDIIGGAKKLSDLKIQVDQKAEFVVNSDIRRTTSLGTLKYDDMYDEKYLIGFSVIEGKLSIKPVVLPVYVGILIAVITGFAKSSTLSMSDYLETMSPTMTSNLREHKLNEKIFILPETKQESEYTYISPSAILNLRVPNGDGAYQGLTETRYEDPIYEEISKIIKPKPKPSTKKPSSVKATSEGAQYEDLDEYNAMVQGGPQNGTRKLSNPQSTPNTDDSVTYESIENPYGNLPIYKSLSEVPLDLSRLSKFKIADCLRLLNLEKYSNIFIRESVDGGLLLSLDESILREEFHFSPSEATKLMKFVKGWRPVEDDL